MLISDRSVFDKMLPVDDNGIHTGVMSDVVLENTRDLKWIFKTTRFDKFIFFLTFIYFSFTKLSN